MTVFARGEKYEIDADFPGNSLRIKMFGDVMKVEDVKNLIPELEDACSRAKPGFTFLVDFTEMGMFGLPDVMTDAQKTVLKYGVSKLASVWSKEGFAKLVTQQTAEKAGHEYTEKRKVFLDMAEAEAWLKT